MCDFLLVFYVTISLSCTISEILALISKKFKRWHDPEWTPYCRTLTCVMAAPFIFCKPNLKCLASFAPKIWPRRQDVEMCHITLTTPIWGTVSHDKTSTSHGQLMHIRFFSLLFLFSTVSFPRCRLILLMKLFDLIQNSISFHVV